MTFEIGQTVWHVASHEKGVVSDIRTYQRIHFKEYYIATDFANSAWCAGLELTDEKPLDL